MRIWCYGNRYLKCKKKVGRRQREVLETINKTERERERERERDESNTQKERKGRIEGDCKESINSCSGVIANFEFVLCPSMKTQAKLKHAKANLSWAENLHKIQLQNLV